MGTPMPWGSRLGQGVQLSPWSTPGPPLGSGQGEQRLAGAEPQWSRRALTELGPIQKFSCWMYLTLS